jgi:hypothetical protein
VRPRSAAQIERDNAAVAAYVAGEKFYFIQLDYRISDEYLGRLLAEQGVKRRGRGNYSIDETQLRGLVDAKHDDPTIAKHLNCTRTGVIRARQRFGIAAAFPRGRKPQRAAVALALMLLAGQAQAHGEYTELKNPNTGALCCNDGDCAVRDPCMTSDMREGLVVDGLCFEITQDMVLPIPSWDGQNHGCFWGGKLKCVVRNGGM